MINFKYICFINKVLNIFWSICNNFCSLMAHFMFFWEHIFAKINVPNRYLELVCAFFQSKNNNNNKFSLRPFEHALTVKTISKIIRTKKKWVIEIYLSLKFCNRSKSFSCFDIFRFQYLFQERVQKIYRSWIISS